MKTTLKSRLSDWNDWDVAAYNLGICLELMEDLPVFGATKHVFWTEHPVGTMLFAMLDLLVDGGVLEKRDEPDIQYRWSPSYLGSWETPEAIARSEARLIRDAVN